jgi:uncharacterized membrane protein
MGPVQVLVIAFDEPTFSGEVLAELTNRREAGIVRLIDMLVVNRDADGRIETLEAPEGAAAGSGALAAAVLGQGASDDEAIEAEAVTWSLADAIPAGSAAAVALIEHLWAAPLSDAIRRAGGTAVEETWLAPSDREALEALVSGR